MTTVYTVIEQDHGGLCTALLTLEVYTLMLMTLWAFHRGVWERWVGRQVLGYACRLPDGRDQFVAIYQGA